MGPAPSRPILPVASAIAMTSFAVFDSLRVVLQAARVHDHGAPRFAHHVRGLLDRFGRDATHFRRAPRIPRFHRFRGLLEAGSVRVDECPVGEPVADDHVQHAHQERKIGSRAHRQIQIGVARDRREARIGHNQLRALVARAPDVVGGDGGALADIRPDNHQNFRGGDVGPRVGRAIHPERPFVRCPGRHHAEAAVVIDVARTESDTRELADQVRLLGGERSAAIDRNGVLAVLLLQFAQTASREIERFVPFGPSKTVAGPHQRVEKAVRMVALQVPLDAFGTEHSAIEREVFPRLEARHPIVANLELNSALLSAEAAVSLHQLLWFLTRSLLPASGRGVVEMRPEMIPEFLECAGSFSHERSP